MLLPFYFLAHPIVHALPGKRLSIYIPCSWPQRAYLSLCHCFGRPAPFAAVLGNVQDSIRTEDSKDSRSHIAEANSFRSVDTGLR